MSAGEISNAAYDRIGGVFQRALTGLTIEQLKKQPAGPESNPIGWLAWHLSRTQDKNYSELLGEEQAWTADGWCERFGQPADRSSGNGDSLEQVREFDPVDSDTLIAYFEAAREKSRRFLDAVTD
ncbi:MAG: DinB family protein, partial [Chloroflexota bacterium]|nr:DinB family protein [Chloroflexota bacterium]